MQGARTVEYLPPPDWPLTRLTSLVLVFSISGLSRLPLLYVDSLPPLIIASATPSQKGIYRKTWVIFNLFLIVFPPHFFGLVECGRSNLIIVAIC